MDGPTPTEKEQTWTAYNLLLLLTMINKTLAETQVNEVILIIQVGRTVTTYRKLIFQYLFYADFKSGCTHVTSHHITVSKKTEMTTFHTHV